MKEKWASQKSGEWTDRDEVGKQIRHNKAKRNERKLSRGKMQSDQERGKWDLVKARSRQSEVRIRKCEQMQASGWAV